MLKYGYTKPEMSRMVRKFAERDARILKKARTAELRDLRRVTKEIRAEQAAIRAEQAVIRAEQTAMLVSLRQLKSGIIRVAQTVGVAGSGQHSARPVLLADAGLPPQHCGGRGQAPGGV